MVDGIYKKRVIFAKGKQARFLSIQVEKLNISWARLADEIGIRDRTLNDWKREKYSMPIDKLEKICELADSKMPKNIRIKPAFWYIPKSSKLGALASIRKYGRGGGSQSYQKKKWYEWWNKKGKYHKLGCLRGPLPIKIPSFSKDLAEFTGIMLGDGNISSNQIRITTNRVDDSQYAIFIKNIIKKLFDVDPAMYSSRKKVLAVDIMVSRKKLVEFCNKKLGLNIGNKLKQGLDIPKWIRKSPEFEKACVRGLIDTDGCIFDESHNIKSKKYNYKRLNFTSASAELIKSVFDILEKNGLFPKIRNNRCVQIEDKENIKKYFQMIGTSNPKHLKRYYK